MAGDYARAAELGGFCITDDLRFSQHTLTRRLHQIRKDPTVQPWLLRAIVERRSQTMCGRIGFHSAPGPADLATIAPDGVELGYEVHAPLRGQGFAKEAAMAMMFGAFHRQQQQCFIPSISPQNEPSVALASSLRTEEIGSHIDDEDGLELYFQRRFKSWPVEWTEAV